MRVTDIEISKAQQLHEMGKLVKYLRDKNVEKDRRIKEYEEMVSKQANLKPEALNSYEILQVAREVQSGNTSSVNEVKNDNEVLQRQNMKLGAEVSNLMKINTDLNDQVHECEKQIANAERDKQKELSELNTELSSMNNKWFSTKVKLETTEKSCEILNESYAKLEKEKEEIEKKLKEASQELLLTIDECQDKQNKINQLENMIKELKSKVQDDEEDETVVKIEAEKDKFEDFM